MKKTFYFLRINGVDGRTFATKRAAVECARRYSKTNWAVIEDARISVWFRDVIGQHIPVNWRAEVAR